jgi:hypothetical protein
MISARAVIVEGETPARTLESGWKILKTENLQLPSQARILVLIDTPVPEGNPASINPDSFLMLIKCLQGESPESITILPNTLWGTDPIKNITELGLIQLFPRLGIQLSNFTDFNQDPKKFFQSFTYLVMITQVRVDPVFPLWSSIPSLASYIPPTIQQPLTGNDYIKIWIQESKQVYDWRIPDLVINDAFYILQGNGPLIQSNTTAIKTQTMIMSTDIGVVDRITYSFLGLDSDLHSCLDEAVKVGFKVPQIMEIESNVSVKAGRYKLKIPPIDPTQIFIPSLTLCLGTMNVSLKYSLMQLLFSLKSILIKDAYFMGNWYLLAGDNPSLPGIDGPIVLFGDEAIQSTEAFEFRQLVETKKVYSAEELDTIIYRNDGIMRDKVLKLEEYNRSLQEKIDEKEDLLDREEAVIQANKNKEKKILKLKYKQTNLALKMRMQNEKAQIQNSVPKIHLNEKILEIPGKPPSSWEPLLPLAFFWTTQETPTLRHFIRKTKEFYHYSEYNFRKIRQQWKIRKNNSQRLIKERYITAKKEMPKKLQELKLKYDGQTKNEKASYQKAMKVIDEKYAPLRLKVIEKRKQAKLEQKQNKKVRKKLHSTLQEEKKP